MVLFFLAGPMVLQTQAQQQLGLMHGNYNVTEALRLNPAAAVAPKPYLDIHLVGVHAIFDNNLLYLPKSSFAPLFGRRSFDPQLNYTGNAKNGQLMGAVHGPSFNLSIQKWVVGAGVSVRNISSTRNIPVAMARILENDREDIDDTLNLNTFNEDDFRIGGFTWGELAFHVGRIVYQENQDMITVGVRPKLLVGIAGGQFAVNSFDYTPLSTVSVRFDNVKAEFVGTEAGFAGLGAGVDLGVEYRFLERSAGNYTPHSRKTGCEYIPYKFKIGLSILDIGRVRMQNNSHTRKMSAGSAVWDTEKELTYLNVGEVLTRMDEEFGTTIDEQGTDYTMRLPTAISVNGDYRYRDNLWVGFAALYGLPAKNRRGAEELAFLSVVPRYETRFVEFAVPVSVNRMFRPRLGTAFRFGPVQFGTDNIITWLFGDAYRLDGYFSLTLDLAESNRCKDNSASKVPFWRFRDCNAPGNDYKKPKKKKRKGGIRMK